MEAWGSFGSTSVRLLKESALEAVWNEQNRQWSIEEYDPEKVREAYEKISKGAQASANERGLSDAQIVEQIRKDDAAEEAKKKRRRLLSKTKAVMGKSMRVTAGTMAKTGKVVGRTTKLVTKTAVATATLDRRLFKEAVTRDKKKMKDRQSEIIRLPSLSSRTLLGQLDGKSCWCTGLSLGIPLAQHLTPTYVYLL